MTQQLPPGMLLSVPTTKRIVLEFTQTPVVDELAMALSYENIPEGWAFVHAALCDALKQVAVEWRNSERVVRAPALPGNGVAH